MLGSVFTTHSILYAQTSDFEKNGSGSSLFLLQGHLALPRELNCPPKTQKKMICGNGQCYPSECKMHKLRLNYCLILSPGLIAVHTDFKKQTYCPPIVIPDIVLHKDKCKHKQTNKYCLCEIFSFFLEVTALV